jgi:hypothetical protein
MNFSGKSSMKILSKGSLPKKSFIISVKGYSKSSDLNSKLKWLMILTRRPG